MSTSSTRTCPTGPGGKLVHAFTVKHGNAIRSFVEALPGEITSVVVHCEGGFSRSCAVAVALCRLYGYRVEPQHLAKATPSIVRVMTGQPPLQRGGSLQR